MPLVKPNPPAKFSPSVDQQTHQVPKFAPCPRSAFTAEHTSWFHITAPHMFSNIDICQSCYDTTFRNTPYMRCLSEAPPRPENTATRCDFSDRWNRAATSWLFSQNAPDLTLLGHVAEMQPDEDGPCPNLNAEDPVAQEGGKPATTRTWFCLLDPTAGSLIDDLTVCSDCINRLTLIFPCLNNIFRPVADGAKVEATCDLLTAQNEHDGRRGAQYMTQLTSSATQTLKSGTQDTHALAAYVKKWARIPVCVRSQPAPHGTTAYTFPTSITPFTACEECYTLHISPLLTGPSPSPAPLLLSLTPSIPPTPFFCTLYSPRLQRWFADALTTHDLPAYQQKLGDWEARRRECALRLEQMGVRVRQLEREAQVHELQMVSARSMEVMGLMRGVGGGGWYVAPADFSQSTVAMGQSHQALLQAEAVSEDMELVRREWAELYE